METVETNETEVRSRKRNRRRKKKNMVVRRIILIILLILVIVLGILGVQFASKVEELGGGLQGVIATVLGQDEDTLANLEPIYCLVMGESTGLTDTIMLCAYNPRTQEASILSIPRDTYYGTNPSTATPYYKINALYSQGPEKTVAAVERITGVDIPYYIVIDTKGVIDMVDLIGGVEFDVPIDMYYHDPSQGLDIDIRAGLQRVNGEDAEGLLRFRHNDDGSTYTDEYGMQDLGRMRTQREFVKAAISQTVTAGNIPKINQIIDTVFKNIKTNMNMDDVINYVPYTVNFDLENLNTATLPGNPKTLNDYSFFLADSSETADMVDELFTFSDEKLEDSTLGEGVFVEIINGSEDKKSAKRLEKLLKSAGYQVVRSEETTSVDSTIVINRTENDRKALDNLNSVIKTDFTPKGEATDVDFSIIIGKDYVF